MHRRRRGAAEVLTSAVVLGAVLAPGAAAHVTVQPTASRPGDLQRYRAIVPNERETGATTGVDLQLPAGVTFVLAESVQGWRVQAVRRGGRVSVLRWRGGDVRPGEYAELRFVMRNPVKVGQIAWKALQRYDGGEVVRWIGSSSSEQPAALTRLSEDATPVDVVSTHGEDAGASAAPAAAAPAAQVRQGRDGLTLGVAIAALALGLVAVGLQLVRRRGQA